MTTSSTIKVRPASFNDQEFILSLVPRLVEFGPPTWRDIPQMIKTDIQVLTDQITNQSTDTAFLTGEDENCLPLGFIQLLTCTDYYKHEKHGHIANVILAAEGEDGKDYFA